MPVFDYQFTVNASLEAVRDFHGDTSALKTLTPPPTIIQLHKIEPLADGSVSTFTLWVGPLPLHWKAVYRNVRIWEVDSGLYSPMLVKKSRIYSPQWGGMLGSSSV